MLYVCSSIQKYQEFRENFWKTHDKVIDLSKVPSSELANESDSVSNHHAKCAVFIGYLEPGWMLDGPSQTRMRKLFRRFDVGMCCYFPESIPFSWKNEIHTFYTGRPLNQNGNSNSVDNGSSLQDKSNS